MVNTGRLNNLLGGGIPALALSIFFLAVVSNRFHPATIAVACCVLLHCLPTNAMPGPVHGSRCAIVQHRLSISERVDLPDARGPDLPMDAYGLMGWDGMGSDGMAIRLCGHCRMPFRYDTMEATPLYGN